MTGVHNNVASWTYEFKAVFIERVRETLREKVRLAEKVILDRIDAMEASPVSADSVDERWAMCYVLSILGHLQIDDMRTATHI